MAVKAKAEITLYLSAGVKSVTRYYKLQSSTASAPSKPTANPPSDWTATEPSYVEGSTNSLYTSDLTVLTDGTWAYSEVFLSSSYEAAKLAYNKAQAAGSAAEDAKDEAVGTKDYAEEVDGKASEALKVIEQLADSISQLVVGTDADGAEVSMMEQTANGWKFSMTSVMESIKANADAVGELDDEYAEKVRELQEQLAAFGSYVSIGAFEDGTPYVELGNSGAFKVRITNEKMAFLHVADGVEKELTTIDTETMNIASATIGDELRVGGLCISKRGNGNVGFTWKEA